MGKGKKKGSGGGKKKAAASELSQEEVREELLALEAIYGEDLAVHEQGLGFSLHITPHPGEAAANHVSCQLAVSFPDDYPCEAPALKLSEAVGLAEEAVRQLSKQLHTAAAGYAADGEVCCFQLITLAQEFLQQHNCPPEDEASEPAAPQSLWHEMLQRDMAAAAEHETSYRAPMMGDTVYDALGGGLFSDAAELPGIGPGAVAAVPVMEVRSKELQPKAGSKAGRVKPPLHPAALAAAPKPAAAAAKAGQSPAVAPDLPSLVVSVARTTEQASPFASLASSAAGSPQAADAAAAAAAGPSLTARSASRVSLQGGGGSKHVAAADSGVSLGGGGSMLKTLGHSLRHVLPRPLRKFLDGAGGATPDGSEAGEGSVLLPDDDRQLIRQELFLGHLLTLAASSGAVPPHALPSIAAMLQAEGLIPKWLAFTLTQQPALFDRAFQRCFSKELEVAQQEGEDSDDPMAWACQRFWKRRAAPLPLSRSMGRLRSQSGLLTPHAEERLPSSRYETDFTELRALGRGGYGVVVAAINRLDGRQYAVKKIPLDAHSAGAYARIMREVTTLSRLQHINVVRYFQAWVEASSAAHDDSDDSELDEWGSESLTPTPHSPAGPPPPGPSLAARGGAAAGGRGVKLAPVTEVSREGRASTPSKGTRGLRSEEDSSDGSSSDSDSDGSSSSGEDTGVADEPSASFGFGGNMAVAGANALLAEHGNGSERQPSSLADGGFLSAWDTSASASQTATLSSSAGAGGHRGGGHASYTNSGTATATGTSGEFTFDRSRPARGGASGTQPSQSRSQRAGAMRQLLLIQMEFCPRTLRDVLDSGELDEERRWSILRQILAGLAHIHAQGIIHRDLKPANTFIDSQGIVKLGDFGLAKYNTGPDGADAEPSPIALAGGGGGGAPGGLGASAALLSDTTGLVGTSYYISPEIREGWASYDAKVDLFSLGVMTFELWHPFATAMERAVLLRDLREHGVMPAKFEARHPVVCRLIRWLMAANPAERPTALEVQRSELLPPQVLDEQLTDLLRCLPDNPAMHEKVLDAVFSLQRASGPPTAVEAPGAPIAVQMAAREHVLAVLRDCFQRHGAVAMASQELGLAGEADPLLAVKLLTPAGTKLSLRYEMRAPFVAWLMQQLSAAGQAGSSSHNATLLLDGLRRYEIAAVQRHAAGQGLPRSFLQADLDFVLPGEHSVAELLLGDAEVITATYEALAELPECGEVEVRLGHRRLFELALDFIGVSREARGSVIQLLSTAAGASPLHATARSKRWPSIKAGLEGIGLSAEAIGRCRQLVLQAAGEAEAALFRLRTLLAHVVAGRPSGLRPGARPSSGAALACLDDLQQLLQYLQAWGLSQGTLVVDPLLAPHSDAFSGALFQCHLVQGSTGTTAVVAAGGRYDTLLKQAWARQSALSGTVAPMPPLHAAGVTLNVDRLVHVAQASSRWRQPAGLPPVAGLPRLSQADVLVAARGGGGLLKERMALARSLWDAGIPAEMLPQAAPSLTDQYEYAQTRGIPWLVIIQASTFGAADTVRVKAMNARLEEDVSVSDLPSYLLSALHPHGSAQPAGNRTPHATGVRPGDDADAAGEGEEPAGYGGRERQRRGGRR